MSDVNTAIYVIRAFQNAGADHSEIVSVIKKMKEYFQIESDQDAEALVNSVIKNHSDLKTR